MTRKTTISVSGVNAAMNRLRELAGESEEAMLRTVEELTNDTHATALANINPGAPSAPGDYPSEQTGDLKRRIAKEMPTIANPVGHVGTDWNLGLFLEVGTAKMLPRPWLLRSFRAATRDAAKRLKSEFMRRAQ